MAKIRDLLQTGRTWSFEFFPPKTEEGHRNLEKTLGELQPLNPSFVSVTYGAGGSTRETTRDIVFKIERDYDMTAMAHLTCVAHTREQLVGIVEQYRDFGLENILCLGGDPPKDMEDYPQDLEYASQLIELVREVDDFSIGVAAQPELHPRSPDRTSDRRHLAGKLLQADFGLTQFFFEPEPYLQMMDELAALGCTKPVMPGIMPVLNVNSVGRMAEMSGSEFPPHLLERYRAAADEDGNCYELGVELASELCRDLLDAGVPGLHFYTLNRSAATCEIFGNLGLPR